MDRLECNLLPLTVNLTGNKIGSPFSPSCNSVACGLAEVVDLVTQLTFNLKDQI